MKKTLAYIGTDKRTDYAGNIIYEDGKLKRILTEGGYIEDGKYYFYLTDHLGNNRVVADEEGNIVQTTHYYPFGMPFAESSSPDRQPYKYNGKELLTDKGLNLYDYGARHYDATIGRWHTPDPMAEKYANCSPYVYCMNNPVENIDPMGMAPIYAPDGTFLGTDDEGISGNQLILDKANFKQGMTHADAQKVLWVGEMTLEAQAKMDEHVAKLSSRPDYDGFVTISEGIAWAKAHPNALENPTPDNTLYIDTSKLDFGELSPEEFKNGPGEKSDINLFNPKRMIESIFSPKLRSTIYALGRVNILLINEEARTVRIVNDEATVYDWNTGGGFTRNLFIKAERLRTGINDTHGFKTFYYGIGRLKK